MGQKSKVGFKFVGTKHRGVTCQKLISVFFQNSIFPTSNFSFSSLLAQISQSRSPFALPFVPFSFEWLKCGMVFFFFLDFILFICTLSKNVSAQNAFMYKNMYTHKWVCVCTYEYTYMLWKINGQIFFDTRRHVIYI